MRIDRDPFLDLDEHFSRDDVIRLAQRLRDEGMGQIALYRMFGAKQQALQADHPGYDALLDAMDLIWSGPWSKGRGLFDEEITEDRLKNECGRMGSASGTHRSP